MIETVALVDRSLLNAPMTIKSTKALKNDGVSPFFMQGLGLTITRPGI